MCSTPRMSFCGWKSPLIAVTRLPMFLARSPTRSRSLAMRSALTTSRRSTAIGCRRAIVSTAFSSTSRCSASIDGSSAIARWARSASRLASASTASATCFSARPPISATMRAMSCRSTSKALAVCSLIVTVIASFLCRSAEPAGDIVLRALVTRRRKHLAGRVELHQLAQIHERREIGDASGLLHVVGHDHDRIVGLELVDQLLDLGGRDRIKRRAGLVEQDRLGLDRDGARDAQALLLTARQAQTIDRELVLHLVPQGGAPQRHLDPAVKLRLWQFLVKANAEGDVLVDRHRKRGRLLEHHADAGAQQIEILARRQDVTPVEQHLPLRALVRIEIVHPVEHAQQRRFPAARRTDERRHLVLIERHRERLEGPVVAVEKFEVADRDLLRQIVALDRAVGDGHSGGGYRCNGHD